MLLLLRPLGKIVCSCLQRGRETREGEKKQQRRVVIAFPTRTYMLKSLGVVRLCFWCDYYYYHFSSFTPSLPLSLGPYQFLRLFKICSHPFFRIFSFWFALHSFVSLFCCERVCVYAISHSTSSLSPHLSFCVCFVCNFIHSYCYLLRLNNKKTIEIYT